MGRLNIKALMTMICRLEPKLWQCGQYIKNDDKEDGYLMTMIVMTKNAEGNLTINVEKDNIATWVFT